MPAASPLEGIETGVATELQSVAGLLSVTVAPFADAFTVNEDGTVTLNHATLPGDYPGAIVSLNDDDISVSLDQQAIGLRYNVYRAPLFVAVYARADGTTLAGARRKAWEVAHAVIAKLINYRATDIPEPWEINVDEGLEPGTVTNIVIDPTQHAVLVRFWARYHIESGN